MGKITLRFKTILLFIIFLGFTNFLLSETKINFSEMVLQSISGKKDLSNLNLSSADTAPMTTEAKKSSTPAKNDSSEVNSSGPVVSIEKITPSSCIENSDGAITISVTGGESPYKFEWASEASYTS